MDNDANNNFDLLAPLYDRLASLVFGNSIKNAQIRLLDQIPDDSQVLILGGGSGWILPEIFEHSSPRKIHYIDASVKMIGLTQKQLDTLPHEQSEKVKLIHGTQQHIPPSAGYQVIICFFFFDLFSQQAFEILLGQLNKQLLPGGKLLVADFFPEKGNFFHAFLLRLMFAFFRLTAGLKSSQLPSMVEGFQKESFRLLCSHSQWNRLIKSMVWQKGS